MFFFEKKNQKTSLLLHPLLAVCSTAGKPVCLSTRINHEGAKEAKVHEG